MRTVKSLTEELSKFPDEAIVWAYEGESSGLGVRWPGEIESSTEGFIYCTDDLLPEKESTRLLKPPSRIN